MGNQINELQAWLTNVSSDRKNLENVERVQNVISQIGNNIELAAATKRTKALSDLHALLDQPNPSIEQVKRLFCEVFGNEDEFMANIRYFNFQDKPQALAAAKHILSNNLGLVRIRRDIQMANIRDKIAEITQSNPESAVMTTLQACLGRLEGLAPQCNTDPLKVYREMKKIKSEVQTQIPSFDINTKIIITPVEVPTANVDQVVSPSANFTQWVSKTENLPLAEKTAAFQTQFQNVVNTLRNPISDLDRVPRNGVFLSYPNDLTVERMKAIIDLEDRDMYTLPFSKDQDLLKYRDNIYLYKSFIEYFAEHPSLLDVSRFNIQELRDMFQAVKSLPNIAEKVCEELYQKLIKSEPFVSYLTLKEFEEMQKINPHSNDQLYKFVNWCAYITDINKENEGIFKQYLQQIPASQFKFFTWSNDRRSRDSVAKLALFAHESPELETKIRNAIMAKSDVDFFDNRIQRLKNRKTVFDALPADMLFLPTLQDNTAMDFLIHPYHLKMVLSSDNKIIDKGNFEKVVEECKKKNCIPQLLGVLSTDILKAPIDSFFTGYDEARMK